MVLRATVDAGAGGSIVNSVTGTANQVTASPSTGAVIVGLATNAQTTTLALGGASIGTDNFSVTGTSTLGGVTTILGGGSGTQQLVFTPNSGNNGGLGMANGGSQLLWFAGGTKTGSLTGDGVHIMSTALYQIGANSSPDSTMDTFLGRQAAASWRFGAADVDTGPIAQSLRTQGTLAGGTSNVAGANWTQIISPGKGTGVGGSWILQTTPAGSTGTTVNAGVTRITVDGPGNVVHGAAALATNVTDGFIYIAACAGAPSGTPTSFTGRVPLIYDSTNNQFYIYNSGWKQPKTPAGAALVTWQ